MSADLYLHVGDGQEPPTDPPAPDKNWIDPVKINRAYLKKIKKDCVQEEFKGLKKKGLFLLEVFVDSIKLNSQIGEDLNSGDKDIQPLEISVKFLDFPFVKINVTDDVVKTSKSDLSPLHTELLQNIYTVTGDHVMKKEDDVEEERSVGEGEESWTSSVTSEQPDNEDDEEENEKIRFEILKGKSMMISMSGLEMIRCLQKHPISVKVDSTDVTVDGEKIECETLGTSFIRLPERFRLSVLWSIKGDAVLPSKEVKTDSFTILNNEKDEVGEVSLTVALTCFGKAVINCSRKTGEGRLKYDHTEVLRSLKLKHKEEQYPCVNPRLALEILRMEPLSNPKSSKEILEHCLGSNLVETSSKERNDLLKTDDCIWYDMVKKSLPKTPINSVDSKSSREERIEKIDHLWRKHLNFIRDLKSKEHRDAKSCDSLEVVEIQVACSSLDGNNPSVNSTLTPKSLSIGERSISIPGSRKYSSPKTSLTKRKFS